MSFHKYIGDSKMFEYDKYYRDCKQQNKPFIKAKLNPIHGNFTINIDLIPCNYIFLELEKKEIKKLIKNEIKFVNSNCKNSFNDYTIDEDLIWIDGVSSEHVDFMCNSLYDLIKKHHN
ncbi:MAG: hypothetical protein JW390_50145 [Nitrosopumilus sp.]|nr:hypothetical protein [Candidatus Nitrosopumilus limneticus]